MTTPEFDKQQELTTSQANKRTSEELASTGYIKSDRVTEELPKALVGVFAPPVVISIPALCLNRKISVFMDTGAALFSG